MICDLHSPSSVYCCNRREVVPVWPLWLCRWDTARPHQTPPPAHRSVWLPGPGLPLWPEQVKASRPAPILGPRLLVFAVSVKCVYLRVYWYFRLNNIRAEFIYCHVLKSRSPACFMDQVFSVNPWNVGGIKSLASTACTPGSCLWNKTLPGCCHCGRNWGVRVPLRCSCLPPPVGPSQLSPQLPSCLNAARPSPLALGLTQPLPPLASSTSERRKDRCGFRALLFQLFFAVENGWQQRG